LNILFPIFYTPVLKTISGPKYRR